MWISEQTAIISLYSNHLLVFKTEAESVYCSVRTGPLNQMDALSSLRVDVLTYRSRRKAGSVAGIDKMYIEF